MAHIIWIDEGNNRRAKVMYEVKTLAGRKRKSKTFPKGTLLKDINNFKNKVELQYERAEGVYYKKMTVEEAVELFMETYGSGLSPTTYKGYYSSFYAKPYGIVCNLGQLDIRKVKLHNVQTYANMLVDANKSSKTISNRVRLIHTLFDRLRKLQILERDHINPAEDVQLPKVKPVKKKEAYDFDEINLMTKLVEEYNNPYLKLSVWIGLYSGLRRSEMACLTFDDIDFERRIIHVTKALVRGQHKDYIKDTKTEASIRDIPITMELLEVLRKRKLQYNKDKLAHGEEFEDSGYLFSDEYGHPYTVQSITHRYQRFQDFAEKRGLRKLNFHYLRHAYATLLLAANVDIRTAMGLLGHTSITMTANVYASSLMSKKREAVDLLDNLLKAHA